MTTNPEPRDPATANRQRARRASDAGADPRSSVRQRAIWRRWHGEWTRCPPRFAPTPRSAEFPVFRPDAARCGRRRMDAGDRVGGLRDGVDAGLSDVLIANQVVGPVKAAELARIAGLGRVLTAVDSEANAEELSAATKVADSTINVIIEIDVGLHRSGVRSTEAAVALAERIEGTPGLQLTGLLGYEGHCMLEPDRKVRVEKATAANQILVDAADEFDRHGLCTDVVAGGGFGTWDVRGATPG